MKNIFVKTLLFLSILSFAFAPKSYCFNEKETEKPIKITVHISDDLAQEPQWVYWFSLVGKNYTIEDSVLITNNQKKFSFNKSIDKNSAFYYTWLTFEKNGPKQIVLFVMPGETLDLSINSKNSSYYSDLNGSLFHKEDYENKQKLKILQDSVHILQNSLLGIKNMDAISDLESRINKMSQYIKSDSYYDFLIHAISPISAVLLYQILPLKYPNANMDSLKLVIEDRFPNNEVIEQFLEYKGDNLPETNESKTTFKRYTHLANININKEHNDKILNLDEIFPYTIGDKVRYVSLKGLDDSIISLKNIKTDYVFIDFWAAWCAPCRKEIPYLKKVAGKYPNTITIYAISLDNSEMDWRNAIETDKSEIFSHVYGGSFLSSEASVLRARFGVYAIPSNFLLNKNREIIAVDLRGEELMNKMEELIR